MTSGKCHLHSTLTIFFSLFIISLLSSSTEAAVREYTLTLTFADIAPACVTRRNVLVNGQFPAPAITANVGDTLVVTVVNNLVNESNTVHFHGFHQRGTPFYDGLSGLSQCPIPSGGNFTHVMTLNQSGTYFYHLHRMLYAMELYGPIIIYDQLAQQNKTPSGVTYDEERVLVLSDFFKRSTADLTAGLLVNLPWVWIGDPDAILINGKSVINCSIISSPYVCTNGACSYSTIDINPAKTYRFRVIGATGLSFLSLAFENHTVEIFEADGYYVQPYTTDLVTVNSGQRFSVLLRSKTPVELAAAGKNQFWISAYIRWRPVDPLNGLAVLRYTTTEPLPVAPRPGSLQTYKERPEFPYVLTASPLDSTIPAVPQTADRTLVLVGKQQRKADTQMKWTVNNLVYHLPENSVGLAYVYFNQTSNFTTIPGVNGFPGSSDEPVYLSYGEVVDVVLQNTVALNGICEQHSWHLHGHSMWILGGGPGVWNGTADQYAALNLANPAYRDSTTVFPFNNEYFANASSRAPAGTGCGWHAFRFVADNPGAWALHCHVTSHMEMGMQISLVEAMDRLPPLQQHALDNFKLCYPVPETYSIDVPTSTPTTAAPTSAPTTLPTAAPTSAPTSAPTPAPTPSSSCNCGSQSVININFANLFTGFTR